MLNKTCLLSSILEYKSQHIDYEMSISEYKNESPDANYLNQVLRAVEEGKCELPKGIHRTVISEVCDDVIIPIEAQGLGMERMSDDGDTFISTVMSVECKWTSFSFH